MNDPHVESLSYRLETDRTSLQFQNPPPLDYQAPGFDLHLEDGRLTVTMKDHHASATEARQTVRPLLDSWEFDWALRHGRREMKFVYENANVIDRQPPPPGTTILIGTVEMIGVSHLAATAVVGVPAYPMPPSAFKVSPDVETLWNRYERYVEGREPLAGMAYACFTFITKIMYNGKGDASQKLNISDPVLKELGRLAGGKGERKYPTAGPYSAQKKMWLEAAIRLLIRRVGEQAAGVQQLRQITMNDLPGLQ